MEGRPTFARGQFDCSNGKRKQDDEWEKLSSILNELGPIKSAEQWRKVWKNEKQLARKQNANWHKALRQTGNNIDLDQSNEPSDRQKLIINIIGTESSVGLGIGEAGFKANALQGHIENSETESINIENLEIFFKKNSFDDSEQQTNSNILVQNINTATDESVTPIASSSFPFIAENDISLDILDNIPVNSKKEKKVRQSKLDDYASIAKESNTKMSEVIDILSTHNEVTTKILHTLENTAQHIQQISDSFKQLNDNMLQFLKKF